MGKELGTLNRQDWLEAMLKIVDPVLLHLEQGKLKASMPLEFHKERAAFAPLEAFGRSMLGLAPWLEVDPANLDPAEAALQEKYRGIVLRCLDKATDPASDDYMLFHEGGQPLVDAAFLAHALVRAKNWVRAALDERIRNNLIAAFESSRNILAVNTNWIFFSAMVEAGLWVLDGKWDKMRVAYALRMFDSWYKGDGVYGDGPQFHFDYYNSFVIQPMYVDLMDVFAETEPGEYLPLKEKVVKRASRYATVLERNIGPEGSYPVVGRSICYRFGAFQMLSQAALEHRLEKEVSPASVRCGLSAVIQRVMSAPDMFDENGFLTPGVYGKQPELAEHYINIGSLYLCSSVFLPLGLCPQDPFWSAPAEDWSGRKVWSGGHITIDHALE